MSWLTKLPRQVAGQPIAARTINQIAAAAEWACKIRVSAPLDIINTGAGPLIRLAVPPVAVYECQPSAAVTGATGTWPSLTPISFTADVYQIANGKLTKVVSGATVWNGLPASLAASKVCYCLADGSGAYVVISQSCT